MIIIIFFLLRKIPRINLLYLDEDTYLIKQMCFTIFVYFHFLNLNIFFQFFFCLTRDENLKTHNPLSPKIPPKKYMKN